MQFHGVQHRGRPWAISLTLLLAGALAAADNEKSGANRVAPDDKKAEAANPAVEAATQLGMAYSLAHYGRKEKNPLALLVAAELIHRHPGVALDVKPTSEAKAGQPANAPAKADKPAITVQGLIAEAKALAAYDDATMAIVKQVASKTAETSRGAVGGPKTKATSVNAYSVDTYTVAFRGGESATVLVSGDGDTDLDLYVYDEGGNLIAADEDYSDECVVRFCPRWTGPFVIRIRNRGSIYNRYVIITN